MNQLEFDEDLFKTMVGGSSDLGLHRLRLKSAQQAKDFMRSYGYNLDDDGDSARLWSFHRRAVTYIETQLLLPGERVPPEVSEAVLVKDLTNLLLWASETLNVRQRWSCAILRVMHVLNHLSNDLFTAYSDDIQEQILRPYQDVIFTQSDGKVQLGTNSHEDQIALEKFDIKPFKTSNSSITKLLAKPEEVAFALLDKMGVRFVTHSVYDCFRVLRWLDRHHVVNYAHLIPDQSNNTLYPLNLFFEAMDDLKKESTHDGKSIEAYLHKKLAGAQGRAAYREKINIFTSPDYRFMKFIVRKLIRARSGSLERPFMFFYPYEVQIMDGETYRKNSSGPSSHSEYKSRQRQRARERVFGGNGTAPDFIPG